MNIRDIQSALKAAGFDPGPIDGMPGRLTSKAIREFQAKHGLTVDGIVGPKTAAVLFPDGTAREDGFGIPTGMPWLLEAYNLMGTRERPGRGSNEAIMGWAQALELTSYNDDDIPWCGLFVAHCVGSQLTDEALPGNPLGARKWESFGVGTTPQLGSVLVFWRGSRDGWLGHVGFYWAEDDDAYHVLGGNQSNAVTVSRLSKRRLLQARWPKTVSRPAGIVRKAAVNGQILSQNEA